VRYVKGNKGSVVVAGRKLAVDAPADGKLTVGIGFGDRRFVGTATLRGRGRHKLEH
jgi:hypothetical protein